VATNPNNPCGFGGPARQGEIVCFQECVFAVLDSGGVASRDVINRCASSCVTPGCGTIASATNEMIACLDSSCFAECLQN